MTGAPGSLAAARACLSAQAAVGVHVSAGTRVVAAVVAVAVLVRRQPDSLAGLCIAIDGEKVAVMHIAIRQIIVNPREIIGAYVRTRLLHTRKAR